MMKMKKRLAGFLTFIMMFSLLSMPQGLIANAADNTTRADYLIYFDANNGKLYKETNEFSSTTITTWEPAKTEEYTDDSITCSGNKLTLQDFYIFPAQQSTGIVIKGNATIELKGENKIDYKNLSSGMPPTASAYCGIYAYNDLSVTGTGSLDATALHYGIYVGEDLTVQDAFVTGSSSYNSITANNITINSGSLTGMTKQYWEHQNSTGPRRTSEWGVAAKNNIQINGGTVIGDVTNNRDTINHAIRAEGTIAWNPNNCHIVGGNDAENTTNANYTKTSTLAYFATTTDGTTKNCSYVKITTPVKGISSTTPSNPSLVVGGSTNLEVKVEPSGASNPTINWSSSDDSVVSVDEKGKITGNKEGTATITATTEDGNHTKEFTITVTKAGSSTDSGTDPNNPNASGNGTNTNNPNASGNGTNATNPNGPGNGTGSGTSGTPTDTEKSIIDGLGVTADTAKQILDEAAKLGVSQDTLLITDKSITNSKSDADLKGSTFGLLKARATNLKKNAITVKWSKVKNADGYIVYGNKCGAKNSYKKLKTFKKNSTCKYTQKKLKKGTYYKYLVVAYKKIAGTTVTIAAAKTIHATTAGGKYGVAKAVKVNKTKVTLARSKTFKIKASEIKQNKKIRQHRKIKYESSNTKIASVNGKGVVKAKKKGSCDIYVYAQNGVYKKIKITVK